MATTSSRLTELEERLDVLEVIVVRELCPHCVDGLVLQTWGCFALVCSICGGLNEDSDS